ncbi:MULTISPECIES: hypothetical protein [unclassified Oleiphilus]|nr:MULTISPECIES: hypothetical protein [unclassified Oleiphilus]KZY64574.1 hypothetical protein A3738_10175 [Oleiphilus sp. HI0066]KZY68624.1 hypothetical protein A3739_10855 [Oleiphilus sp. HI0067]KZZ57561.1 hypothetical protein A3762_09760 [Oleiphilus sp. HI0125]MCH2159324.1 hypothetical protein [Oleiphilaceae bacterium]
MKHYALAIALSVAACSHIILYTLLNLWPAPTPNDTQSIPVTLVLSQESAESQASQSASSQTRKTQEQFLTTKSYNDYSHLTTKESASNVEGASQQANAISKQAASNQNAPARRMKASEQQIIEQQNDLTDPSIRALSTKDLPVMTEYEQALLQHLLDRELYTQLHQFMQNVDIPRIDFTIEIKLFENGAIKSASIKNKSANIPIERIATTAAYNASPYPRPPESDYEILYTYAVTMSYKKTGNIQ